MRTKCNLVISLDYTGGWVIYGIGTKRSQFHVLGSVRWICFYHM